MEISPLLASILSKYDLDNQQLDIQLFGKGHINDTFLITFPTFAGQEALILQKININVFPKPDIIINNNNQAYIHLKGKCDLLINPVKTKDGEANFVHDSNGDYWRMVPYISKSVTLEQASSPNQAFIAANAFGQLIKALSDTDISLYKPTIDNFNDIQIRYNQLKEGIAVNFNDRISQCAKEIEFVHAHAFIIDEMTALSEVLPLRITHNDTKINNILFDKSLKKCLNIIDLDTLMPGFAIHDFGDMVRTFSCPAGEDEGNLEQVYLRPAYFEALAEGFVQGCGPILARIEKKHMVLGAQVMTFMMGIRFLTDFLNGDIYYKIDDDQQNLRRAKNQFALLNSIIDQENRLDKLVSKL